MDFLCDYAHSFFKLFGIYLNVSIAENILEIWVVVARCWVMVGVLFLWFGDFCFGF